MKNKMVSNRCFNAVKGLNPHCRLFYLFAGLASIALFSAQANTIQWDGCTGNTVLSGNAAMKGTQYLSIGVGNGSIGQLTVKDNASITHSTDFNVSDVGSSRGTLYIQDNAIVKGGVIFVGKNNTSIGVVHQSGGSFTQTTGGECRFALAAGSKGTYNLSGGIFSVPANLQIGAYGKG